MWKKIAGLTVALFIFGLTLEVSSRFLLRRSGLTGENEVYRDTYLRAAYSTQAVGTSDIQTYKNERIPHPYFGYSLNHGNNYGFPEKRNFPFPKKADEFVIGIFGGSTARHFTEFLQSQNLWKKITVNNAEKKLVILNFCLSGGKQPQQFIIGSFFLEGLDAAILIDGWNESQVWSVFPEGYELLFGKKDPAAFTKIYLVENFWSRFNLVLSHLGPVSGSHFLRYVWHAVHERVNGALHEQRTLLTRGVSVPHDETKPTPFATWSKYFGYFNVIAREHGVKVFHYLAPNLLVTGSKIPSRREEEFIRLMEPGRRGFLDFYGEYLKAKPASTDFVSLFRGRKEELYIDHYTHLNAEGYRLLAQGIARNLAGKKLHLK